MLQLIVWATAFSLATAMSTVLMGDRALIQGNLWTPPALARLLSSWKFIAAMGLALGARASFIVMNNLLLGVPRMAENSTTITAFVSSAAFVFIVAANAVFLGERLSPQQMVGGAIIVVGIFVTLK